MALSQSQFCSVLGKLQSQVGGRSSALTTANYGLARMAGAIALARGEVEDAIDSTTHLSGLALPADTNLYTQLITACPGLLPPLPKDAALAALAVSALQALIQAKSPGDMLNTITGDPLGRLTRVRDTLKGLVNQVKSSVESPASTLGIPGTFGGIAKAAAGLITNEAKVFATKAITDALDKAGIDPNAANRCAGRLCAVGSTWNPPG